MLTSPGIGSGLDINSLVSQLVAAEGQAPALRLDRQEADYTSEISAVGTLKSALATFDTAVGKMTDVTDFRVRKTTSSDKAIVTATADDTAAPGQYDVEVVQLATSHRIRSGNFTSASAVVGQGTLTVAMGTDSFQITVDSTNETLEGVRDAINNHTDNPGVNAAIVNVDDGLGGTVSRLVLSASSTGVANSLTVTAVDGDGNNTDNLGLSQLVYDAGVTENMTQLSAAQDSLIRVFNQDVTRSTNTISDAITGVTLDLESASAGSTETITVEYNQSTVTAKLNEFIKAYNDLVDATSTLGAYDAGTETAGALLGDATLRTVTTRLRAELGSGLSDTTLTYRTLADIGITTGQDGKLSLDGGRLDTVMADDFNAVGNIFASTGGYAERLEAVLTPYVESNGVLDTRIDGLNAQIERVTNDREKLSLRLEAYEERIRAQFFAMDTVVSQLSATSDYLGQQLANLPGFTRGGDS